MSDDDALFGRPETERQQGFSPMPSSTPKEPEEEPEIYSSDRAGMPDATEDLIKVAVAYGASPMLLTAHTHTFEANRPANPSNPIRLWISTGQRPT